MTHKWGIKAGNTGWFKLSDVEVPEENLLGNEDEGFKIAMFALDQGRYTVAAGATGLIRACLDESVKWARERHTFGQPIGQHQLVKQMIANMARDYECARLLWLKAGVLKNQGRRNTKETSLAKWVSTVTSRASRLGRGSNPRLLRVFRRVSRGTVLAKFQGRRDLRRDARDSHPDASGLCARIPRGQTDADLAAEIREELSGGYNLTRLTGPWVTPGSGLMPAFELD